MTHSATPLLNHMYTRFREVFGTPNTMLELDSQWTLRPNSDPRAPALFLMVNGSFEKPAVWVFDPYDGGDNVWRSAVEAESDVEKIIKIVLDRVAAASRLWLDGRRFDGYLEGHLDGLKDGHLDGHNGKRLGGQLDGHRDGHLDGHLDGHAASRKDQHLDGHKGGHAALHKDGHAKGQSAATLQTDSIS